MGPLLLWRHCTCINLQQLLDSMHCVILTIYIIHSSAPLPGVTISSTGTLTAGKPFSFFCTVTLADGGSLTEDLTVQWVTPASISVHTDRDIGIIITNSTGTSTSTLQFTPLRTSHGGQYTCKATTTAGNDSATETLTVQSERRYVCKMYVCLWSGLYSYLHSPSTHTGY